MSPSSRDPVLEWGAWLCVAVGTVGLGWAAWVILEVGRRTDGSGTRHLRDGRSRVDFTADQVELAATLFAGSFAFFALAVLAYWLNQRLDNKTPW